MIFSLIIAGCTKNASQPQEPYYDFAIFLLANDTLSTLEVKYTSLDSLTLAVQPLVTTEDVVTYKWSVHEVTLTAQGYANYKSVGQKVKSTFGLPFVVVAANQKIYLGTFYPLISSYIHMDLPFVALDSFKGIRIARAPDSTTPDRRNDTRIYDALLKANKII
jgi:hypothetical protein